MSATSRDAAERAFLPLVGWVEQFGGREPTTTEVRDGIALVLGAAETPQERVSRELPPITCGMTMIGGPCDRTSLHEGLHTNPLSRTIEEVKRVILNGCG